MGPALDPRPGAPRLREQLGVLLLLLCCRAIPATWRRLLPLSTRDSLLAKPGRGTHAALLVQRPAYFPDTSQAPTILGPPGPAQPVVKGLRHFPVAGNIVPAGIQRPLRKA